MSTEEYEDDELYNWRVLILGVTLIFVSLILGFIGYHAYIGGLAVKAGLCEGTLPGIHGSHWVKCSP